MPRPPGGGVEQASSSRSLASILASGLAFGLVFVLWLGEGQLLENKKTQLERKVVFGLLRGDRDDKGVGAAEVMPRGAGPADAVVIAATGAPHGHVNTSWQAPCDIHKAHGRLERHTESGHGDVCRDPGGFWACPAGCVEQPRRKAPYCIHPGQAIPAPVCRAAPDPSAAGATGRSAGGGAAGSPVVSAKARALWSPWVQRATDLNPVVPIYVSCGYNKGRSGHELKDVATPFILGTWLGWTPCSQDWWKSRAVSYFNPAFGVTRCKLNKWGGATPELSAELNHSGGIKVFKFAKTTYDGMTWDEVQELLGEVKMQAAKVPLGGALVVYLDKSTRVHMGQVWSWHREGKIPAAVFGPVRRALQARFFRGLNLKAQMMPAVQLAPQIEYLRGGPECQDNRGEDSLCVAYTPPDARHTPLPNHDTAKTLVVAAHFRRGDISGGMAAGEFTGKAFAQRMINEMRRSLSGCPQEVEVHLFTEKQGADDLKRGLHNLTKLWAGGMCVLISCPLFSKSRERCAGRRGSLTRPTRRSSCLSAASWEHDMSCFVNADVLVITNSSLSTWAAHFARGECGRRSARPLSTFFPWFLPLGLLACGVPKYPDTGRLASGCPLLHPRPRARTGLVVMPSGYIKHFKFDPSPAHVVPFVDRLAVPRPFLRKWGCSTVGGATRAAPPPSATDAATLAWADEHG